MNPAVGIANFENFSRPLRNCALADWQSATRQAGSLRYLRWLKQLLPESACGILAS